MCQLAVPLVCFGWDCIGINFSIDKDWHLVHIDLTEAVTFPGIERQSSKRTSHAILFRGVLRGTDLFHWPAYMLLGLRKLLAPALPFPYTHAAVEAKQSLALGIFCGASCHKFVRYFQKGSIKPCCVSASKYYLMWRVQSFSVNWVPLWQEEQAFGRMGLVLQYL